MKSNPEEYAESKMSIWVALLLIVISSIGLAKGADWLVDAAVKIAKDLGVSERVISITIVAIGTSLPELTASVIAALKKQPDLSVGNIIGSNIFNIFSIIGFTALIKPMKFDHIPFTIDLIALMIIGFLLGFFMYFIGVRKIKRGESAVMLAFYLLYIVSLYYLKF